MKKLYISTLLLCLAFIFNACQISSFNEAEYDAIFKSIKKIYTLNEDGSISYQYQHELKYLTHLSFNRLYGESFIVYNPHEQELKINTAETKTVDGRTVPSPENAFNKVLPRFAAGAPAYNHLREMVVTHTGLELGCTVFFDYELMSKQGYLPFLNDNIVLQERMPVEYLEITIKVPEGKSLNFNLQNIEAVAKESQKDGYKLYTWKFKDIPKKSVEDYQGHDNANLPRLVFSSVSLNESLGSIIENADLTLSNEIKDFANAKVADKKKDIEIVRELQKIVGSELNSYHIPMKHTAYTIRPLNDVWKSNGGTSLEKILLLNELLKDAGIESKVILATGNKVDSDLTGNLNSPGHFYVLAIVEDEKIVLSYSPKQKNSLAFLILDNAVVDLHAEKVSFPAYISEVSNGCGFTGSFELNNEGGISGTANAKVTGYKNPYFNGLLKKDNTKEAIASFFPKAKLTDIEVAGFDNKHCEVSASISQKEIWKENGDYYFIEIPSSNYGIKGEHISTLLKNRETPLHLSQLVNESYDFTISIPGGFNFVAPELKKEISNETGNTSIEISFAENTIHIKKSLQLNKKNIPASEYAAFKALIDLWNKKAYNELILKKEVEE